MLSEIARCEPMNVRYLVLHPGSHKGQGEESELAGIWTALDRILKQTEATAVKIAFEITGRAAQECAFGDLRGHVARIMDGVYDDRMLVFCLDTCHAYAAGYDVSTEYLKLLKHRGWEKPLRTVE
jgi:deoxyribonuclease-4